METTLKTYEALFGQPCRVGLSSLNALPPKLAASLKTEEELEAAVTCTHDPNNASNSPTEQATAASAVGDGSAAAAARARERVEMIGEKRKEASEGMKRQAEVMLERSRKYLKTEAGKIGIGDQVLVYVPHVDRSKLDSSNIPATVTSKSEGAASNGFRLVTAGGTPLSSTWYPNQFQKTPAQFLSASEAAAGSSSSLPEPISLRMAVKEASLVGGQGMAKCNCAGSGSGGSSRCEGKRCFCRKMGLQCNSRCHNQQTCCNK